MTDRRLRDVTLGGREFLAQRGEVAEVCRPRHWGLGGSRRSSSPTNVPANHTGVGGVGFRAGVMPVVVTVTDALTHGVGETATCTVNNNTYTTAYAGTVAKAAHSRAQTKTALNNICAR